MFNIYFPYKLPLPSIKLPPTLISLEKWVLITINGKDAKKYIQNQITYDIYLLNKNQYNFSAHCNNKGKVIGNICIFYYKNNITFITRKSIYKNQIKILKKYAVFSKVKIKKNNDTIMLGLAGIKVENIINKLFTKIPNISYPVVTQKKTTLIYYSLPKPRFILITNINTYNTLIKKIIKLTKINNSKQWLLLDIESGYPIIDVNSSEQFLPQAINLKMLNAINFNKGCYIGQENIAKAEYLGINKKKLYWLEGKINNYIYKINNYIEININKSWRNTGTILAICKLYNKKIWLQIILNNSLIKHNNLRINKKPSIKLIIKNLPYKN